MKAVIDGWLCKSIIRTPWVSLWQILLRKQDISALLRPSPSPFLPLMVVLHCCLLNLAYDVLQWFYVTWCHDQPFLDRSIAKSTETKRSNWKYTESSIWWQGRWYLAGKVSPWMWIEERSNIPLNDLTRWTLLFFLFKLRRQALTRMTRSRIHMTLV